MLETAALADIPAFRCAHAQDAAAGTGCTVIVAPEGAVCGVDVRGGGPATRETDLLKPENMVQLVHAVVLSGGSAFGLEASCGVMDALSERGIGFELAGAHVPIVTGACLFDLLVGDNAHPDKAMGRAAAEAALREGAGHRLVGGVGLALKVMPKRQQHGRDSAVSFPRQIKVGRNRAAAGVLKAQLFYGEIRFLQNSSSQNACKGAGS